MKAHKCSKSQASSLRIPRCSPHWFPPLTRPTGPTSPSHSHHSPPSASSPLPKIKLNIRPPSLQPHSRPGSSSSRSRAGSSVQRRGIFSDDSSSDLTPAEDEDDIELDGNETEDDFPVVSTPRKGKKRESLPNTTPTSTKDKGQAKAHAPHTKLVQTRDHPSPVGPNGRDRKRVIKLGEVARRRARDDKFGFGGGDRFSGAVSHLGMPGTCNLTSQIPSNPQIPSSLIDSDSTSSYGDDESERENTQSVLDDDETDDEFMGMLPIALAGQEVEDLAYGGGPIDFAMDEDTEQQWWQEEEDDEDFIANLTGSDIEGLQSQSSVQASDSDDPMSTESSESESDDKLDEFGFPIPFAAEPEEGGDQPLILMENWDGQFVLVQPRHERPRRKRSSQTNGSVGESTSVSAGEQQLVIDADANDTDSDWSGVDDESDGGDTTDSMAEEDMPVLDSPALDEIIGQQLASYPGNLLTTGTMSELDVCNPAIVVTDMSVETPALSTTTTSIGTPVPTTTTPPILAFPNAPGTPVAPAMPVMGTFVVSDEPCAHAVIDGTKSATKSPFTRRKRNSTSDLASVVAKRRSGLVTADAMSPSKKARYSSIPGHPRFIAARRAAQSLVDPLDRENTSEEDDTAFSLEDMLDASVLRMNDEASSMPSGEDELHHLFRFDKVPVSMYMRRNFNTSSAKHRQVDSTPQSSWHDYTASPPRTPGLATGRTNLADTLADTLAGPASRMLISPLLAPIPSSEVDDGTPMSRKDRRKARRREGMDLVPLQI